jgi:hypothetical protein
MHHISEGSTTIFTSRNITQSAHWLHEILFSQTCGSVYIKKKMDCMSFSWHKVGNIIQFICEETGSGAQSIHHEAVQSTPSKLILILATSSSFYVPTYSCSTSF